MTGSRLLIVVAAEEEERTRQCVNKLASNGWQDSIRIISGHSIKTPAVNAQDEAKRFIEEIDHWCADEVIITKDVICNKSLISRAQDISLRAPAASLLRQKIIKQKLKDYGLFWRSVLEERLAHWDSKKSDAYEWEKQFKSFGFERTGEILLRSLDIITPSELSSAFDFSDQTFVGKNIHFAYLMDEDPASSANRLAAMLTRKFSNVGEFSEVVTSSPDGSYIVLCEDALWTGTEIKKIISRILLSSQLKNACNKKKILIRHCLVSDYGLNAVQHYIENNNIQFIEMHLGERQRYIKVLRPDLSTTQIREKWHLTPEEFDCWLAENVQPHIFQNGEIWDQEIEIALSFCESVGSQLIDGYVGKYQKNWSLPVKTAFALGAGRFGCATVFSHSVPKVCLPMYWLSGEVEYGGRKLFWKPLLYDARRIYEN